MGNPLKVVESASVAAVGKSVRVGFLISIASKAVSALATMAAIPLLLSLLGVSEYSVWLALTSIIAWLLVLDFGLGNAVRNRVAARPQESAELSHLVAGSLQFFVCICAVLVIGGLIVAVTIEPFASHLSATLMLYAPILFALPLSVSTAVLQGEGRFALNAMLTTIFPGLWILALVVLRRWLGEITIHQAALVFSTLYSVQALVQARVALRRYLSIELMLSAESLQTGLAAAMVGGKFFLLQLTSIALFYSGTLLSFYNLSAHDVALYDFSNKLFSLGLMAFNIIISIAWTEIAKHLGNARKKRYIYKILLGFSVLLGVASLIIASIYASLSPLLSGGKITARFADAWPFALLVTIQAAAYSGAVFLNAAERIDGQIVCAVLAVPAFIVIFFLFLRAGLGASAIPLACCISLSPSLIFSLHQGKKIANA